MARANTAARGRSARSVRDITDRRRDFRHVDEQHETGTPRPRGPRTELTRAYRLEIQGSLMSNHSTLDISPVHSSNRALRSAGSSLVSPARASASDVK